MGSLRWAGAEVGPLLVGHAHLAGCGVLFWDVPRSDAITVTACATCCRSRYVCGLRAPLRAVGGTSTVP